MSTRLLRLLPVLAMLGVLAFPASAAADNPPTLTITSPTAGTVLSGTAAVTVDAQDDVGVDHVIYRFNPGDGNVITLGTANTAPFNFSFDTTTLPNCNNLSCTLYAQAVDSIGQTSGGQFGVGVSVGVHNAIVVNTTADDNPSAPACSLREAIAAANTDAVVAGCKRGLGTDDIQVPAGVYDLNANFGQLNVSSDLNIVGAGAHSTDIRGYSLGQRVLEVSSGSAFLGRLTIEGGNTLLNGPEDNAGVGGGIYVQSGATLHTQNLIVALNHADTSGGGIDSDGTLFVSGSTIENNTAGFGAGIDSFGPTFGLDDSTVTSNQAQTDGGGLYLGGSANTIVDDTIANNLAGNGGTGTGGGIAGTSSSIQLTNTLLAQNGTLTANSNCSAGGIVSNGSNLDDDSSCGLDALGDKPGVPDAKLGALDTSGSTDVLPLTLGSPAIDAALSCPASVDQIGTDRPQGSACDIGAVEFVPPPSDYFVSTPQELVAALSSANANGVPATVHLAAGQYDLGNTLNQFGQPTTAKVDPTDGGPITLEGAGAKSTILDGNNESTDVVDVGGSEVSTIEGVTIQNGTSDGIDDNGNLVLKDSVVQGNPRLGVESTNAGLQVYSSTITGNGDPGISFDTNGGIYSEAPFTAVNTTISDNNGYGLVNDCCGMSLNNVTIAANQRFGLSLNDVVTASNTIVADNAGGDCTDPFGPNMTSAGHNLDSDSSCEFSDASDQQGKNPLLGPLQDNGGPTPTMALGFGSPALDAGDDATCAATDQRGVARPQGAHCDIGASELFVAKVNTAGDPEVTSCDTPSDLCSLRAAIRAVNSLGGGAIEFAIDGAGAPTISLSSPLDAVTAPVLIDGSTQPGTLVHTPGVALVSSGAFAGLDLGPGSGGSSVHGFSFGGFAGGFPGTAISVESDNNFVTGNWIGVGPDGSSLAPSDVGIEVTGNGNQIGGSATALGNRVAGSNQGILVGQIGGGIPVLNTTIQGNLLEDNAEGVFLDGVASTVVGNDDGPGGLGDVQAHPELGNVISGSFSGIDIEDGTFGTIAAGNFLGVDRSGAQTAGNGDSIQVSDSPNNQIGPGNVIAHSTDDGVFVYDDGDGAPSDGNRIVANSIFDSARLGIELHGGNNGEPAPVITSAHGSTVSGTFSGNGDAFIEIFVNPSCNAPYSTGAGKTFATFVTAGPGEVWTASVGGLTNGEGITATATDEITNDTSQFSNCSTVAPQGEEIAFESNRNGSSEIWAMHPDGSSAVQLTNDPVGVTDSLPSISPDGQTIVYQRDAGNGNQIWAIDSDGSNPRQLTTQGTNQQPTFSPDGSKIAFDSNQSGSFQLWVMNPDGTGQTQITHTNGNVGGSGWSPDGLQVAINDTSSGTNEIYKVNVGTGTVTGPLTSGGPNTNPHWSPDGSQILYAGNAFTSFSSESVFVVNADGTNQHNLTNATIFDADPAWSPDGTHIAFVRDLGGQNFNVFTANADGTNQVQLTHGTAPQRNSFPNWGLRGNEPAGSATGASASFSSGQSVEMPGTVPIGGIPLSAFDPQPPGAPPISTNGTQLNQTQLNQTQLNQTQLNQTQLNQTQLNQTQLNQTQLNQTQLNQTQLNQTSPLASQLNQTQLNQTQLNQTQLNQTQLNQTQLNQTQLNQTSPLASQLNQTQLNQTQLNQTQLNQTQLNQTQLNQTQLNQSQLNQTQLNQTQLNQTQFPDGWPGLLQYTDLAGVPLQTLTLHDVMSLTTADVVPPLPTGTTAQDVIDRIQHLTFANLEIQSTSLAQLSLGALLLGDFDINQLGSGLTDPIERQLNEWCLSFAPASDPNHFCSGHATVNPGPDVGGPGIGYFNLIQLTLMGAPVQSLQLNQTQLNQTQLNQTQLNQTQLNQTPVGHLASSASGIVGMQLSRLDLTPGLGMADRQVDLLGAGVPDTLFDCSLFDCSTGTLADAQRAGAIRPSTTVGDLDQGNFFIGVAAAPGITAVPPVSISQLLDNVLGPNSAYKDLADFGDLVGLYLRANDVQWETLPPNLLAIFDPNRQQLSMSAGFTVHGSGTVPADVKIDLPAGFDYVPGSAALNESSLGEPTITGTAGSGYTLEWQLDAVDAGTSYSLSFDAFAGTTVGPAQATETITSGSFSDSSIAAFSVTDSFPGNDTAAGAADVDPTVGQGSVELSTLATAGAVDYYTIPMPAAGTRIQVHLTNLPADYDLALYSPRTTSVRTTTNVAPPLQDGIVPDTQVDLNGGSSGQLAPTGLEDAPDLGIPLVQRSDNRRQDDEDVGMVSPGGGGVVTIAVYGYNGAFSPKPYTLRVKESAPPETQICSARSFAHAGAGTTPDSLPALTSLPANLNTIILVDEKRLGDTYGAADETSAVAALQRLAGDSTLGVSGVVVPVETVAQSQYDAWDSNPCDPDAANAVANAIADEVNAIVTARPSVKYVVFGGGDDQIPFFRLPDLSLIANESGFASQFGPNEYRGSLAAGDLLSDDPYLDTQPVPASGQQLFPPNLAGGRLVETAQDIANAVSAFESAPTPGTLRSSTGFVSGYDFVADGAQQVATNLRNRNVTVTTLGSPTSLFSLSDLLGLAFPTGGSPADVNSWNGHYDNYRAQMANGDILSTSGVPAGLNKGVFFTMGCHAGFQTTDAVVGSTVLDWPQYFAQHNTGFVGNTGYGLGDTNTVAFSEELMADLAGKLGGSTTLGQSLLQAKRQYYLSRVAFSNYDEKALSEAELYGLPMYGVGSAPAPLHAALLAADVPPVTGTTASTSPSQGTLSSFPGTGVQSADFAATPHFDGPNPGANGGAYYTNDGQVQAPNYRPLQPYVSLPAARSGLVAHGVVIDSLTSSDNSPFTPANVRPTLNSSSTEPPPTFTDEAWPEKIPTLVSLGSDQSLNLITGQFFTDSSSSSGVERLWTQINGRVTYSNSSDFTPPTIDSIDAFQSDPGQSDNVVGFTGRFSDVSGNVVFAQVIYDDEAGNWHAAQLQQNQSGLWSAGVPFAGSHLQYFVEVCDGSGNCGYSSNKGNYFDARPLPSGTGDGGSAGTLTISPSRTADTGSWYTGSLTFDAITTAPDATVSVTVDGEPVNATSGITVSGDGAHIVVARDSAGNTASAAYLIDTTSPLISHVVSPATPDGTHGWYKTAPTVTFNCSDNLSGVYRCLVDGGASNHVTLGDSGSTRTISGTATDNAANTSHDSVMVTMVDSTAPATPTFSGITSGGTYNFGAVPASSAISCSSSDLLSGLTVAGCVVTGYSSAVGTHTLTATATDNAGNTSLANLTYTVVKADPTITWNQPAPIVYGTALSATQLNATASVPGTFVYNPAAGAILQAGVQTLSVTFTPTDTVDYNPATKTVSLTVNKATPTITWNQPAAIVYGTALSATQLNATASVPGTFVYNPPAGTVLGAGTRTLATTFTPTDTTDYTTATKSVTLTVNKANPVVTWNLPATMLFGTPLSSTQLNATANVPGAFLYSPPAGTVLQPGPQPISLTFTPNDTANYNVYSTSKTINVGSSQPCLSTTLSSPLTINSGTAYCIQAGGLVKGSVTVQSGGSLFMTGGTISGSLTSTGATALSFCGASLNSTVSISGTTGPVRIGGPGGSGCAGVKVASSLTLKSNTGGISVVGNTLSGTVLATGNTHGLFFSANKVSGSVTFDTNSGGVTFTNNTVTSFVSISNSTGGFVFSGNSISGKVTLKNNS